MEKNDGDFTGDEVEEKASKNWTVVVAEFSASSSTKYVDLGPLTFLAVLRWDILVTFLSVFARTEQRGVPSNTNSFKTSSVVTFGAQSLTAASANEHLHYDLKCGKMHFFAAKLKAWKNVF